MQEFTTFKELGDKVTFSKHKKLGEGTYGVVYKAKCDQNGVNITFSYISVILRNKNNQKWRTRRRSPLYCFEGNFCL